jgi:electron transfer flavoprotein beta subunit
LKIAVCVKHAVDEAELRADPSGKPVLQGAATKMSTFDKNAVEEGLRIKSKSGPGTELVVFTVGPSDAKKTIREAIAMGADRAVLVVSEASERDAFVTAYLLSKAMGASGAFDLILCAEGSSDTYDVQVPAMLGELLSIPYIGCASKIDVEGASAKILETYEESAQTIEAALPLVVSVQSEINEPRYPTLVQIMQASKKPIQEYTPPQLVGAAGPKKRLEIRETNVQSMNRKKVVFEGAPAETAQKLLNALRAEGVISR